MKKVSPKESVEGDDIVLRGSVRAPEGFSEGKPKAAAAARSFNSLIELKRCAHQPMRCPETDLTLY